MGEATRKSLRTPWRGSKDYNMNNSGALDRSLDKEIRLSVESDSGFGLDLSGMQDGLLQIWWTWWIGTSVSTTSYL